MAAAVANQRRSAAAAKADALRLGAVFPLSKGLLLRRCGAQQDLGDDDESVRLAAGDVRARAREFGPLSGVYDCLRAHLRVAPMTYITIAVTAAVIIYLFAALVRPEWF
jgi:F subunit of K+-transporting ATPase (Potass_KdpF)